MITAIQWLKKEYIERGETIPIGVFKEALEIEKQQIKDAFITGLSKELKDLETSEEYYNKTYNNESAV